MTRKHFEALAQVMRVNEPTHTDANALHTWANIVEDLTTELARFNKSFDADKFHSACSKGE